MNGKRLRLGVSSCLLGNPVRYDGGHKHDRFLTGAVAELAEFVPVCPEMEIGLGTPRETLRLVRRAFGEEPRLIAPGSGLDHTERHAEWVERRVEELRALDLDGYVLKSKSPSCGLERVPVYTGEGQPVGKVGEGVFAAALKRLYPTLPLEEEGRLHDPRLRECFFERVFAHHRLRHFFRGTWSMGDLVDLQRREKMLLLAHSPLLARELGALVGAAKRLAKDEVAERYTLTFLHALGKVPSRGRHVNALQHAAGFLKRLLDTPAKEEFARVVDDYRRALVPLVVPLTLLRHHVREYSIDYLADQTYLVGHPRELLLGAVV